MPPKYVKGRGKKGVTAAAAAAAPADDEAGEEGGETMTPGVSTPGAAASGGGSSSPAAAGGAGAAAGDEEGGGAGTTSTGADEVVDSFLAEALPGEEHHHRLMSEAMSKINVTTSTYAHKLAPNARDVKIGHLTVILKGREMLVDADLALNFGCRYGLIGPNGCGKSILMTLLGRRMLPLPANLDVFHLMSEIEPSDMTALEAVVAVDTERTKLQEAVEALEAMLTGEDTPEQDAVNERLFEVYERLDELNADQAEMRAALILHGLGFTTETMGKRCRDFSGGWRMRIALARALFVHPTCLLLDEPTSHLDMEAVVWLERYLSTYKGILLLVSHSQDFMNSVCTDIIRMHKKTLEYYGGNYDTYVATREEKEENQMKMYAKQQKDIAEIKDFVARFGHGTRKMAQQAQSREKLLAKVLESDSMVEKVERDATLRMTFPDPGKLPPPVLMLSNISFAYPGGELLYDHVDFGVDLDSRIALVGPNGRGKTTMLKMMSGELVPITGAVRPHPHLRIARYTQHFVDTLDLNMTPLEYFATLLPDESANIPELRKRLGRYGVSGEMQTTKMAYLSNGIKSRVVFAKLALRTPHLLLLDEPTNGLDIETIDSLADAINTFGGGVVVVSHDMRLISQIAKEIYECDDKKVTRFEGDIMAYKASLQAKLDRATAAYEAQRRAAAAAGKKM